MANRGFFSTTFGKGPLHGENMDFALIFAVFSQHGFKSCSAGVVPMANRGFFSSMFAVPMANRGFFCANCLTYEVPVANRVFFSSYG